MRSSSLVSLVLASAMWGVPFRTRSSYDESRATRLLKGESKYDEERIHEAQKRRERKAAKKLKRK